MNLRFDQPEILLLGLLCVPLVILSWRWLTMIDRPRRAVMVLLRTAVILSLVIMLAGPRTVREHDHLTVIGVLDVSGSVKRFARLPEVADLDRRANVEYLRRWFRAATETMADDDRFGLIVFDGTATVISVPVKGEYVDDNLDVSVLAGTNIAAAIRLALAMFPADTARRIVLVSDGNETLGNALEAAREAAAGFLAGSIGPDAAQSAVPIDVVPITYEVSGDVQVVRVEAPPTAQGGQTVTVRIVLAATMPATGRLVLRREGVPIDLNGSRPGNARRVAVPAGRSVHLAQVELSDEPINRFEAIFEPDEMVEDAILDNNVAETFTTIPTRGTVLVVDPRPDPSSNLVAAALEEAEMPVTVEPPHRLGADLLSLQRYDLIILDNVAAPQLDAFQQTLLTHYVHDLGGGLIMIGGPQSFGAGGWNGTVLEEILPLELDPPQDLRLSRAALVLVLDKSGSMNQRVAGTRTTQQKIANEAAAMAIESLRRESLVGVITFDFFAHVHVPLQRNDDPHAIAEAVRAINPEGGTNLFPALRAAHDMLAHIEAQQKLVVCLSDGRSHVTDLDGLVARMAADGIKLTTIAVGDDADHETLQRLAKVGGGEFYSVRNPRTLPRVLVDSVQVINKPLLKEVPFVPVVRATGATLTIGMDSAPMLDGLVITSPRAEPHAVVEMTHPDGEPLLAHWQVGLGRVAAFTSDADGGWSRRWIDWPGYATFWAQLARTMARPGTSQDAELMTQIKDDRLQITLEAASDSGFLDYLHVDGTVYAPNGTSRPVRLRQTAPGRYEASVAAVAPGNYVVALSPRRGTRRLAPVIGGASQSSSAEFRRYRSNTRLLEQIRELTGGRQLDVEQPRKVNLFDRSNSAPSIAALPVWPPLLWAALGLLLLDVASRRLAWSSQMVARFVANAVGREGPPLRAREAAATLATLRGVEPKHGRPSPQPRARLVATQPDPPRPAPAARGERPDRQVDSAAVTAALDALRGRSPTVTAEPSGDETPTPAQDAEPPDKPSDTTGSLLEARKRARRNMGE